MNRPELTDKQKKALDLIRRNPTISLRELAATLEVALATAQSRVQSLIRKGYLRERKIKNPWAPPKWELK